MSHYETYSFEVAGLSLQAKRWLHPKANGRRIIALHGWLDNCASFDGIAAHLEADVVCLDLAGHGRSAGRAHLGAYNVWLDVPEVLGVADQLGWGEFELLGHSRGAAIAFVLAGTFPKRVTQLTCLDGIFPLVAEEAKAPEQLFHSINTVKKQLARQRNMYATFEEAVVAREQGMFPLSATDALCLANWGVEECAEGYFWRYDVKVTAPSELRLTMAQVEAFADNISAPVQIFVASEGILLASEQAMRAIRGQVHWQLVELTGSHHFHMSDCAQTIAQQINVNKGV